VRKEKGDVFRRMPETSFNNMLAQSPDRKQKRSITGLIDLGIFVSQAHPVK
jgi:hypothetical protein